MSEELALLIQEEDGAAGSQKVYRRLYSMWRLATGGRRSKQGGGGGGGGGSFRSEGRRGSGWKL